MRTLLTKRYGWLPDMPDYRDYKLSVPLPPSSAPPLPERVDLRQPTAGFKGFSKVEDQGQLGSCTANAIVGILEYLEKRHDMTPTNLSRLYLYYREREIEDSVEDDAGAFIRDGIKVAVEGVPAETVWPYKIEKFAVRPSQQAFDRAAKHKVTRYERIQNPSSLTVLKTVLSSGSPFVFGFTVYDSFESFEVSQTGMMPMPSPGEAVLGGHAVVAAGYDDATQRILVRNSWGEGWGEIGYFWMPYDYIVNEDLCDDFWVIYK